MLSPEQPEGIVAQTLHAERKPVDAGVAKRRQPAGLHAGRIGLERDFEVGRGVEQAARVRDQRRRGLGFHQARRAAAEEDRQQVPRAEPRRLPRQFPAQRRLRSARLVGMRSRTWLLKSQYGHLARQNGQWI